jgi:tRNA A-37 threonylcarbamoyl transferase component Bud32
VEYIGPYKIVRRINSEGSGLLYEAIHEQIQRRAAIKVLHKELAENREAIKRFLNEARIVNLINHPSMVSIYEQGQLENGAPYIIMEYLHGETLRERLRRLGGKMEPLVAIRIARQVVSALAAAHAKEIVHRDIKPASIMLIPDADTPDGERVKVLNFGIAKLTQKTSSSLLTQAGVSIGTPAYMSPEQCKNPREVIDRSDVYSLGILIYEMLAGAPPFNDAEGAVRVMMAQMQLDPPPLGNRAEHASPELCTLVHRMLAKQPDARPSAADVKDILTGLSGGKNTAAFANLLVSDASGARPESGSGALPPAPDLQAAPSAFAQIFRNRTARLIAIGAAAAVLLGIVGIIVAIRTTGNENAKPQQITWVVQSEPAGAEVTDERGQVLGQTPWQSARPMGHGLSTLTLKKHGYATDTVVLDRARDGRYQVTLVALPASPSPPVAAAAPPADPPKGKSKSKRPAHKRKSRKRG